MLAGCTTPDLSSQSPVNDPYEAQNRQVHAFNVGLDRTIVRPLAVGYTNTVPDGVEDNIGNLADTLSLPGTFLNQVLQGKLDGATRSLVRFSINATFGFAGLADVASDWGIPEQDADFGETLAVWGLPQGAYLELPVFGPSSERAAVGLVVDIITNPLSGALYPDPVIPEPYDYYATGARIAAGLGQRGRFKETIDGILYESVDSYAATRDAYLQNRAFQLEQAGVANEGADDIYDDLFEE